MINTIWRNNKTGNYYEVLHVGLHSETVEKMIVYKRLDDSEHDVWIRPYNLFFQKFTQVEK